MGDTPRVLRALRHSCGFAAIHQWSRLLTGVLVELGAVEQRYRAVLEVLDDGVSVTEVARR